ncbi:Phosphoglycerate mutase-like protein AT74 [Glycine soja]
MQRKDTIDMLPKRILMRHGESHGNQNTTAYTTAHDNTLSTMQDMIQTLHVDDHLRHVMGNDDCSPSWRMQFYVSPYVRT